MWGYQRSGFEDAAAELFAGTIAGLVILTAVIAAAAAITIVFVVLKEILTVFLRHLGHESGARRVLWLSLAGLLVAWLIAAVLISAPATTAAGLALAAWSFLAFVVAIETADLWVGRFDRQRLADAENLDSYLDSFAPAPDSSNGKVPNGATHA